MKLYTTNAEQQWRCATLARFIDENQAVIAVSGGSPVPGSELSFATLVKSSPLYGWTMAQITEALVMVLGTVGVQSGPAPASNGGRASE